MRGANEASRLGLRAVPAEADRARGQRVTEERGLSEYIEQTPEARTP